MVLCAELAGDMSEAAQSSNLLKKDLRLPRPRPRPRLKKKEFTEH
jgi:hypothetical protein